jgi:hypothetical protein
MTSDRLVSDQPGATDLPTAAAVLKITVEPVRGVSARAAVPPREARYMISTFGIVSVVGMSTGSAVLLSRLAADVALAALALGFVAIALIAVCGVCRPAPTRVEVSQDKENSIGSPGN